MSSINSPRYASFYATAAIAKGKAVKMGANKHTVVVGAANTDRCIGIVKDAVDAAGDVVEIALPGGGAKALLGEAVSAGNDLCSDAAGSLVMVNAEGDQILCRALESGSTGDLIAVEVYYATAHAAQS